MSLRCRHPLLSRGAPAILALAFVIALFPAAARAGTAILAFSAVPSTTQAGGHPDYSVHFSLSSHETDLDPCDCKDAKDVTAHLPTGLIGNPHAVPQCNIADFASDHCPVDSQVGFAFVEVAQQQAQGAGNSVAFFTPVFDLVPPPGQPGLLAFKSAAPFDTPTFEDVGARTNSDYGLDVKATSIEHFAPLVDFKQVTWGIPSDPVHDYLRFGLGQPPPLELGAVFGGSSGGTCDQSGQPSTANPGTVFQLCAAGTHPARAVGAEEGGPGGPVSSNSPTTPFLQNPTTCGESTLATSLDVLSYDGGETHAEYSWPATTDCAQLSFNPSQSIEPTTSAADSPSGAEFRLTVPQFESPSVPSPSELKAAKVTLPEGFSFAPNVTNGKQTCSDAQARFGTTEEAQCPENSKIGTIFVETPVLPGVLPGAVYLGEPKPGDRFRMILAFDGFGVHVKLPGTATPAPETGQIVISFQNLPQAPFAYFNAHFFGSERGPLDTPTQCGTYEVLNEWTPWDSALSNQVSRQFFTIDEGPNAGPCPGGPRPFHPNFQAGSAPNTAAAHTTFSLNLSREDGEENLASLRVTTPPGFAATLKGVSYCPQASIDAAAGESMLGTQELLAPSCPASSLLGEVVAGAGAGSHPLYLPGKVYLAGPYQGTPLSFVFITPAVSGGYDLGNVVVREGLNVNPVTAQVSTAGAPLPQIFAGIPLRLRQIIVKLNRPGFALNPTNCEPLSVGAHLFGSEGALSTSSQHFQVANCASLSYRPKLSLNLSGGVKRRGHPAIHSLLTAKPGEANSASVSVALPPGELLDNAHIKSPCTRAALNANRCPAGSVLGHAKAITPLLDAPLEGPVYLTTGFGHKLPDLVADLHGQIHIQLDGRVDTAKDGALRTTFQSVPDAPVTTFSLDLLGGSKGLVQNSASLCGAHKQAALRMVGQNGKVLQKNVPLQASCGKAAKHKRRKHHGANADRRAAR
jgi:hypothetical protein